jgi:hypothetical protein
VLQEEGGFDGGGPSVNFVLEKVRDSSRILTWPRDDLVQKLDVMLDKLDVLVDLLTGKVTHPCRYGLYIYVSIDSNHERIQARTNWRALRKFWQRRCSYA